MGKKLSMNITGIMLLLLLSLTALPITGVSNRPGFDAINPGHHISSDGAASITGIPYAWQEINGFCMWASVTMALNGAGVPLDLHEFFAASGMGFTSAYIRINDTMVFYSGSAFLQVGQLVPICEIYGLEQAMYLDDTSYWGNIALETWGPWNPNLQPVHGKAEAFGILRDTLDEGYPVVLWTDPYYLPPDDYQILRDYGIVQNVTLPESGHAIVAVGYDDSTQTIDIMDPGVGSFGENFGYPDDGRYDYTLNYSLLDDAWGAMGYGTTTIKPGNGTDSNFETQLGEFVVSRLLGDQSSYIPFTDEESIFLNFGESAFRGLSYDMNPAGIKSYVEEFGDVSERALQLVMLGLKLESFMTLQYLSYRTALDTLPQLMPETDLTQFQAAAQDALPHMDALSDNGTWISLSYGETHDSLLSNTFIDMMEEYESSEDLDTVLEDHSEEISEISNHLLAIADSWKAAGLALEAALSGEQGAVQLATIGLMASGLLIVVVVLIRRRFGA